MTCVRRHPGTARRGHPEDDLQAAIVNLHRDAIEPGQCLMFAVPNGEAREKSTAARLSGISGQQRNALPDELALQPFGLGVIPGVTDLILVLPLGRTCWVELKIPRITVPPMDTPFAGTREVLHEAGALSREQKRWRNGLLALAHMHRVVRTLGEYLDVLEECGVPYRRGVRPWGPGLARKAAAPAS